jgi:hypothetical protein
VDTAKELVAKLANDTINAMSDKRRAWRLSLPQAKQEEVVWLIAEGRWDKCEDMYQASLSGGYKWRKTS